MAKSKKKKIVKLVPKANKKSGFFYTVKRGDKAQDKLALKKYNPLSGKHEDFVEAKV